MTCHSVITNSFFVTTTKNPVQDNTVLVSGWNKNNQIGPHKDPSKPWVSYYSALDGIAAEDVQMVTVGEDNTFILMMSHLLAMGENRYGQLGLGHNINPSKPEIVPNICPETVYSISISATAVFILTRDALLMSGQLLGFKEEASPNFTPFQVSPDVTRKDILKVAACSYNVAVLTTKGLFSLFREKSLVKAQIQQEIIDIGCGSDKVVALTASGEVYTGFSVYFRKCLDAPVLVSDIVGFFCGEYNVFVLSKKHLWVSEREAFKKIPSLHAKDLKDIHIGRSYIFAVTNFLSVFGLNNHWLFGLKDIASYRTFKKHSYLGGIAPEDIGLSNGKFFKRRCI